VGALALGVAAIVFIRSMRESLFGQMIDQITGAQIGHIQVHGKGWQAEPELGTVVPDPSSVEARLSKALPDARAARRVLGYGLAGSGEQSAAVLIMGIQPDREPAGRGPFTVLNGRGLSDKPAKEAVIGRALADQLQVAPGAELVMLGQATDGSVANDRFTVVGVADAGSGELDSSAVFLNLADAQAFFGLGDGVHQLLVRLNTKDEDVSSHLEALRGALDLGQLEALSWDQMLPELKSLIDQKRQGQASVDFVVFLIVALGVLNAMTMSTFERTREFGVMASLGTRRSGILKLVTTEALLMGVIGFVVGVAMATALALALGTLDMGALSANDMMGVRMPAHSRVVLQLASLKSAGLTVLLTVLAGGLWPAWRASRLKPVEATRYV
jgi:ABC-type lipoprotein release transport system permease subunit